MKNFLLKSFMLLDTMIFIVCVTYLFLAYNKIVFTIGVISMDILLIFIEMNHTYINKLLDKIFRG